MRENCLVKKDCHDCNAKPGEIHMMGCDVECCPDCGGQMIFCQCDDPRDEFEDHERLVWTGLWPGTNECLEYGFYCKWVLDGGWLLPPNPAEDYEGFRKGHWEPCDKEDPEAKPDFNTLAERTTWDKEKRKYILIG